MAEQTRKHPIVLALAAQRDLEDIIEWTIEQFGEHASIRYDRLMKPALKDIGDDPERPGSKARPEVNVPGLRVYHLEFSRTRVTGARVKRPRHMLVYRLRQDGAVEVYGIVHDSRDLIRRVPEV